MEKWAFYSPQSLRELIEHLAEIHNPCFVAGGTDLMIKIRNYKIKPTTIVNLNRIHEMVYIRKEDEAIAIGAMTTFTQIAESPIVNRYARCLGQSAGNVGSKQIRNIATIGGNIANAAPCADSITSLMALGARVKTINIWGEIHEKPIDDVIIGREENNLDEKEVIIEIRIPTLEGGYSAFSKIGSRTAVTISKLNMAIVLSYNKADAAIECPKVAFGALGPKPFISDAVANSIKGKKFTYPVIDVIKPVLLKEVEASIAGRASFPYKREAIMGLAENTLNLLMDGIKEGGY
ncbi:FAD binding domain-containing protein [Alkaliphilus serpentinus]|uniref:Molybdopterin dehydrogenase n=1 Tax=Alkaliphilus serpentinus TaxID=1482731 RepID=A0A833HNG4_9FIRM|nr:FAD binding domain-containing protein [Alkaliphilus serpentinus]KAB3529312.1 molybdopterin dehydrogenase [Alkaliphilus serpentinus]